jgi:hypothetical protein
MLSICASGGGSVRLSKQRSDPRLSAADAHQYALAVVENLAGKPKFARHAPDGRAKADA